MRFLTVWAHLNCGEDSRGRPLNGAIQNRRRLIFVCPALLLVNAALVRVAFLGLSPTANCFAIVKSPPSSNAADDSLVIGLLTGERATSDH